MTDAPDFRMVIARAWRLAAAFEAAAALRAAHGGYQEFTHRVATEQHQGQADLVQAFVDAEMLAVAA